MGAAGLPSGGGQEESVVGRNPAGEKMVVADGGAIKIVMGHKSESPPRGEGCSVTRGVLWGTSSASTSGRAVDGYRGAWFTKSRGWSS